MPRYCYTIWDGRERVRTVEVTHPMGQAPECIALDGQLAELDVAAQARTIGAKCDWPRPVHSHSAGFMRGQRAEAMAAAERDGVPLELAPDGAAIFRNDTQKTSVARWRGLHDNDGIHS